MLIRDLTRVERVFNWNDNTILFGAPPRVDTIFVFNDTFWQSQLVDKGSSVVFEFHDPDVTVKGALLEYEFVVGDVPVSDGLDKRTLKDHATLLVPDLQQVLHVAICFHSAVLVLDFHKYRAILVHRIEVAARNDCVEFVQWYTILNLVQ